MSADNGVYILETKDHEYRVSEMKGVEYLYENILDIYSDELCSLKTVLAYEYTKSTKKLSTALIVAAKILKSLDVCEYGIKFIYSNKTWKQLCKEAQSEALGLLTREDCKYLHNKDLKRIAKGEIGYDTENS